MFSVCVCVAGLILVLMFKPGAMIGVESDEEEEEQFFTIDALLDLAK